MTSKEEIPKFTDNELTDLLDSAFNDFVDIYKKPEQGETSKATGKHEQPRKNETNQTDKPGTSSLNEMFGSDGDLKENWSKLIQSCNDPIEDDEDFRESLFKTLQTISEKAETITGVDGSVPEDELAKMFANLAEMENANKSGESAELNNVMPLMSNIMQNLLSKEFLYPTLSDLNSKFESYLTEHKAALSESDYTRYTKQFALIRKICSEFDSETPDDTDQVKNDRFNRILSMMQTMQTYGSPPTELVGENSLNPDALNELDELKNLQSKCTLM